jgi:lipid A 3-O-deacylase
MSIQKIIITSAIFLLPVFVSAQAIDNTLSFKNINSEKYFRINYENDFFSATDKYYTQGIHFDLVAPWVKNFPLSKVLLHPVAGYTRYGISIEHDGYTPSSIGSDDILYGDRPFAACFFLKTFLMTIDSANKQRFSTTLSTGIIGPGAGGMQMQRDIHRWLHDMTPHGWQYQVHNDAILNYQVDYEKQLLSVGHVFSLDADAVGRAGTLSDKASIGTSFMMGYFDSPFGTTMATKNNFRIYAYEHPEVDFVGYDATLEGGVFNHSSPYTISPADLTHIVFQNRFGFVVVYQRFYLEYFQSLLSNEFRTGNYHVWGGVQVAFGL